jgi:N6-L-threonylcarbamoyladenine synthase
MRVAGIGEYELLGETLDDAAGEAFDKTAKLLGLGYPGGPALARIAENGTPGRYTLPRPMLASGDLDFSFSGLKTAVLMLVNRQRVDDRGRADIAAEFQAAVVDVLVDKSVAALQRTGLKRLVVAGGVGANRMLRQRLSAVLAQRRAEAFYPEMEFCTDNGAMIAFAGALHLAKERGLRSVSSPQSGFGVRPRWDLQQMESTEATRKAGRRARRSR